METIELDNYGRMKYNSEFHPNQGLTWEEEDLNYLINWYEVIGRREMSFALGRTERSIEEKVRQLRKSGIMRKYKFKSALDPTKVSKAQNNH